MTKDTICQSTRLLARRLTHAGCEYSVVNVEISPDRRCIAIVPFERETPSTPYESRPLRTLLTASGEWWLAYK